MTPEKLALLQTLFPAIAVTMCVIMAAWVTTTWLRIKNGYPLESSWGKPIYPRRDDETTERIKLLTQENGQLRAELSAVKDRLANVERIVTDGSHHLDREIEQLRVRSN